LRARRASSIVSAMAPDPTASAAPADRRRARRGLALVTAALAAGLALRLALVAGYHVAAVDGMQYYALSQELWKDGRLAYAPPPAPLAYSRLPGYPLLLAHVAVRGAVPAAIHVDRATRFNAVLDVLTALLAFLVLRGLGAPRGAGPLALVLVLLAPLLIILASHALTETPATFLATLELYLAVRAMRATRNWALLFAALCGAVAGFAQLVRADAVTMAPAALAALLLGGAPLARRAAAVAAFAVVAAAVFAPWPLRNLSAFGHPYFAAWQWRNASTGRPLPTGPIEWARTFTTGSRDEHALDGAFAFELPLGLGQITPAMYDSPAERAELSALFDRYNRERLSPAVDESFRALARARRARAPFRTYVTLPLRRLGAMFESVPSGELSMAGKLVGLVGRRPWVRTYDAAVYALAALGALALVLTRARRTLAILALAVATRCVLIPETVPLAISQRFLCAVFPVLLMLAAVAVTAPINALTRRLQPR